MRAGDVGSTPRNGCRRSPSSLAGNGCVWKLTSCACARQSNPVSGFAGDASWRGTGGNQPRCAGWNLCSVAPFCAQRIKELSCNTGLVKRLACRKHIQRTSGKEAGIDQGVSDLLAVLRCVTQGVLPGWRLSKLGNRRCQLRCPCRPHRQQTLNQNRSSAKECLLSAAFCKRNQVLPCRLYVCWRAAKWLRLASQSGQASLLFFKLSGGCSRPRRSCWGSPGCRTYRTGQASAYSRAYVARSNKSLDYVGGNALARGLACN